MNNRSINSLSYYLLGLSALIMVASLAMAVFLILSPDQGGFFTGLGKALGLILLGAGNLLSWILNLISWYRSRMRWLSIVVGVQSLPALAFAGMLGTLGVEGYLENRASDQRARIYSAIESNNVAALTRALDQCGQRCKTFYTYERTLMFAALHRSHDTAKYLIETGNQDTQPSWAASEFYNARTHLYTCEGTYLSSLGALDLAVAHDDMDMLMLLWPASTNHARSNALWTAGRLDRLAMVKFMASVKQPLVRDNYGDRRETLLRAAANGAALNVGRWLLDTRPIALHQAEIQEALIHLLSFAGDTDTPRSLEFARLLLQHGADRADLSDRHVTELDALLQNLDRRRTYRRNTPGCVAP